MPLPYGSCPNSIPLRPASQCPGLFALHLDARPHVLLCAGFPCEMLTTFPAPLLTSVRFHPKKLTPYRHPTPFFLLPKFLFLPPICIFLVSVHLNSGAICLRLRRIS